ncbi:MAG: creatininase family protein [Alphaproteobacteria bacterium]|nr:creatininase family protein [Alphaproteobacteria bacterium]
MQLHLSTWQEVEAYLERSTAILIPIGSTEQHGPNGLLGTDALCPEIIAREAGEAAGILVAPTFNVGSAQHHLGFAGTITLRPSTMIAAMVDWTRSLVRHGFTRLYWLNGHGGNVPIIKSAFAEIYAEHSFSRDNTNAPSLVQKTQNWWEFPEVDRISGVLYGNAVGAHATPPEVAVTYWGYPQAVKRVEMSPKIAPHGPIHDAQDYRRRFPDGRIGSDPSLATPEHGGELVKAAVKDLLVDFHRFAAA